MLVSPASIDLSTTTLRKLARLLAAHRAAVGAPWRALTAGRQALLVLAHLRNGDTLHQLACGFGIGVATAWRYIHEALELLARQAPSLGEALVSLCETASMILDGTLLRTDRVAADRPFYSGKHKHHGMNLQALIAPTGQTVWVSPALPGSTHDVTAARQTGLTDALAEAGVLTFADKGYHGAPHPVVTPDKGRDLPGQQRTFNRDHAQPRAPSERAFTGLKQGKILRRVHCCPHRITQLAAAILVLNTYKFG